MRRFAIRLGIPLLVLLLASQLLLPLYADHRVESRLTERGGDASVTLKALPALRLLFGGGDKLNVTASGLSVDLTPQQEDVFKQLDKFSDVKIDVGDSRAGPFTVSDFQVRRAGDRVYDVAVAGTGTAGDVARYAGSRLGGGFGQALAGLATAALGGFERPVPFDARMQITTDGGAARAQKVEGSVAGLPAGPLAQIVANALLSGL